MKTGKEYTIKVKEMLNEARDNGKNVYCSSPFGTIPPIRVIAVRTYRGMTLAKSINGSEFPVSELNIHLFSTN